MKIKAVIKFAGVIAAIWAGAFSSVSAETQPARPNIVFIVIDDLGWRDLACMGSQFYESPAIDKLAAEGLTFTRAYEAAPRCMQSRYSIMTGKNHNRPELRGERGLAADRGTLGKAFQQGGYTTFYAGKWHLGGEESYWPQHRGFDIDVGGCALLALGTHFWPYYTMRTDRYRLTVWVSDTDHSKVDATELYDHQFDSQENLNIAKDPANAEIVAKLMEQWKQGWQAAKPVAAK